MAKFYALVFGIFAFSHLAFGENLRKLNEAVENLQAPQAALYKSLADELRCPTCIGLSVLQSDAPFSVEIKTVLVEQVQAGKNAKEILKFFEERFGLWILRTPPTQGFHWFAWYLPLGLIFFGALLVWAVFWRRQRRPVTEGVRSNEALLEQMAEQLAVLREKP